MNFFRTPKNTELPLMSLKGKDYLQVAHRLVWFNEVSDRFRIETDFLILNEEQAICKAKIVVFNNEGIEIKSAVATKRETKKDFPDFIEKAETGSIGRALALMGYGTQFAIADLDEGSRLADSPVVNPKTVAREATKVAEVDVKVEAKAEVVSEAPKPAKISTFRKNKPTAAPAAPVSEQPKAEADEWE